MTTDTTDFYLNLARQTSIDNAARFQRTHAAQLQGDAEDRAFYAERALREARGALEIELQEHAATRAALRRLLSYNFGLKRVLRQLAEKWAVAEGGAAEDLRQAYLTQACQKGDRLLAAPEFQQRLRDDIEVLRDAERLIPRR